MEGFFLCWFYNVKAVRDGGMEGWRDGGMEGVERVLEREGLLLRTGFLFLFLWDSTGQEREQEQDR